MLNYKKQVEFIKKNPNFLLELVEEHQEKVKKKNYKEKEMYYHFKNKKSDEFDFSLGELLVDTYSGLAIDSIYIQNKNDKKAEEIVKNALNNIDFEYCIKDKCLKNSCILGTSFAMLALEKSKENEIGELRILNLSPANTFVKYNEFGRGMWAFRYYMSTNAVGKITDKSYLIIEFIDDMYVTIFEKKTGNELKFKESYMHGFDKLPLAEFSLNEYRSDILTKAIIGTKKAVEILNNADFSLKKALKEYLVAHNIKAPSDKDLAKIINQILVDRVATLNDNVSADGSQKLESKIEIIGGSNVTNFAEWLDFCKYIVQLIFMTSNIPNFSSEDFTNPQSGAALKMTLIPADAKVSSTKSFFKKSIRYLLEVLQPYFKVKYNCNYQVEDFEININSFEYEDMQEVANAVTSLNNTNLFTKQTLVKLSNIVEDAAKEVEAKRKEDSEEAIDYINRTNNNE